MKYNLKTNTDIPFFNYLVKAENASDYYLYLNFDRAIRMLASLSTDCHIARILEPYRDLHTNEMFTQNSFSAIDGKYEYDKYPKVRDYLRNYLNAGDWLNPDELTIKPNP